MNLELQRHVATLCNLAVNCHFLESIQSELALSCIIFKRALTFNSVDMTDHDPIDKKSLSEHDICTKFITPAIRDVSRWNNLQFFEEFTLGKTMYGKRVARGLHPVLQKEPAVGNHRSKG